MKRPIITIGALILLAYLAIKGTGLVIKLILGTLMLYIAYRYFKDSTTTLF